MKKGNATGSRHVDLAGLVISTKQAGVLLKLTQPRLSQLENAGFIARVAPGRWRLIDLVQGYVGFLKDEEKRSSKTVSLTRLQEAKAVAVEQKTAREAGQTVGMDDALAFVDGVVGPLMADMDGFPARVTRDLPMRRKIESELNDVRNRHADRLDKAADLLQTGGEADPASA
jgi:hypothetical protein